MNNETDTLVDDVIRGCADMLLDAHVEKDHGMCACRSTWPCERAVFALSVIGSRKQCMATRAVSAPGVAKVTEFDCTREAGHEPPHEWQAREKA